MLPEIQPVGARQHRVERAPGGKASGPMPSKPWALRVHQHPSVEKLHVGGVVGAAADSACVGRRLSANCCSVQPPATISQVPAALALPPRDARHASGMVGRRSS